MGDMDLHDEDDATEESDGASVRTNTDTSWMQHSSCRGMDPRLWHPERGDDHLGLIIAKQICSICPVKQKCLDYALENNERIGVWGGTTGRERRVIRSQRRTGKNRPTTI